MDPGEAKWPLLVRQWKKVILSFISGVLYSMKEKGI
jgi:hypothetical protein